jgi:hypothetical protein
MSEVKSWAGLMAHIEGLQGYVACEHELSEAEEQDFGRHVSRFMALLEANKSAETPPGIDPSVYDAILELCKHHGYWVSRHAYDFVLHHGGQVVIDRFLAAKPDWLMAGGTLVAKSFVPTLRIIMAVNKAVMAAGLTVSMSTSMVRRDGTIESPNPPIPPDHMVVVTIAHRFPAPTC